MKKIMFVCYGNICRSPMAEFLMKKLVKDKGEESEYVIKSSATSYEEHGNPVHRGTRAVLDKYGISCDGKYATKLQRQDYDEYDLFIGMDRENLLDMQRIFGGDKDKKIYSLLSFAGEDREVADPYWTHDFSATERDVLKGINALYKFLTTKK
jgi:protein-tyrosine phosphatase